MNRTLPGVACLVASLMFLPLASPAQVEVPKDPDRPWVAEGDSLVASGQNDLAVDSYQRATVDHPEDVELWLRLSAVQAALGRGEASVESAERARALAPQDPDPFLMLYQALATAGRGREAVDALEQGVAYNPDDPPLLEALATVKLGLRDWAAAVGLIRQLTLLRPDHAPYFLDLGRILYEVQQYEQARQALDRALELGADRSATLAALGHVDVIEGKLVEARAHFQESIAVAPNAEAYLGLGGVAFLQQRPAEAEANFRRAIELAPGNPDAYFNLGNTMAMTDRPGEAESAYRTAIEADPGPRTVSARLNLAVLLLSRMEIDEARGQLEQAISLDPALPGPYLHLARIDSADYRYDSARQRYAQYKERVPEPTEKQRIDEILGELDLRIQERNAALARGDMHLLQLMMKERTEIDGVYTRIQSGEDFYVVAEENSQLASVVGVDVGYVDPRSMHDNFRDAVVALDVGGFTDVLEGPRGFYVFKRVE